MGCIPMFTQTGFVSLGVSLSFSGKPQFFVYIMRGLANEIKVKKKEFYDRVIM